MKHWTCGLLLALLPAACTLRQPAVVTNNFAFDLPPAARGPASSRTLAVLPFTHGPTTGGQMFLYRADELRYESDFYNRFLDPPGQMLTSALRRWLREARAGEVIAAGTPISASLLIQPKINALYADYRDLAQPRAVVGMRISVVALDSEGNRQLLDRSYDESVVMREVSPEAAVEGWSRGIAAIFASFTRDLRRVE